MIDILPEQLNLTQFLISRNQTHPEHIAVLYQDQSISYGDLEVMLRKAATYFNSLELQKGARILLILPNVPEFVISFLATIWIGAIAVPVHPNLSIQEVLYILNDCDAKLIITTLSWEQKLLRHTNKQILAIDAKSSFFSSIQACSLANIAADTLRDEPAFYLYTSGTTGRPKGVIHRQRDPIIIAESYAQKTLGLKKDDRIYATASLAFAYGLGCLLYMSMYVGSTAILVEHGGILGLAELVQKYQPSILFSLPSVFSTLLEWDKTTATLDFSSIRIFVSACEPISKIISERWLKRFGLPILDGLGATEVSHIFISNRPDDFRVGSLGKPIPGFAVTVRSENGTDLPPNQIGMLWISGDSLMIGYWNRPEETESALQNNFYCTQDQVYCDEEGYFWYVGRKDSLFKAQGQWVIPSEIEEILLEHPSVQEAAIIHHSTKGQIAYLTLKEGRTRESTMESIITYARQTLPSYKLPKHFTILESFPRTVTGKIQKNKLAEAANEQFQNIC